VLVNLDTLKHFVGTTNQLQGEQDGLSETSLIAAAHVGAAADGKTYLQPSRTDNR
tara:strand:+ start:195 stop:359 length:165 start_codon:yes stop_codon:yes gene_type:complete